MTYNIGPLKTAWSVSRDPFNICDRNYVAGTAEARIVKFCTAISVTLK